MTIDNATKILPDLGGIEVFFLDKKTSYNRINKNLAYTFFDTFK